MVNANALGPYSWKADVSENLNCCINTDCCDCLVSLSTYCLYCLEANYAVRVECLIVPSNTLPTIHFLYNMNTFSHDWCCFYQRPLYIVSTSYVHNGLNVCMCVVQCVRRVVIYAMQHTNAPTSFPMEKTLNIAFMHKCEYRFAHLLSSGKTLCP